MYIRCLQWLFAWQLHGCHQPMLTSKYHVSTVSGRAILFYWCVLFISMPQAELMVLKVLPPHGAWVTAAKC